MGGIRMSSPTDNAYETLEMAIRLIIDDRNKLLRENKELKEDLEEKSQQLVYLQELNNGFDYVCETLEAKVKYYESILGDKI
jgi:hypothetical protein